MAQVTIENNVKLERLLASNPEMEKKVQKIVRKVLTVAQKSVQRTAMPLSSKEAYLGVRKAVYKKFVMGGNLNIISGGKSAGKRAPLPPESQRKKTHDRGGNRIPRSKRTEDLLSYAGPDRSFILRFLNGGTTTRTSRYGNRGAIAARNWFGPAATQALEQSVQMFDELITKLVEQEFNQ